MDEIKITGDANLPYLVIQITPRSKAARVVRRKAQWVHFEASAKLMTGPAGIPIVTHQPATLRRMAFGLLDAAWRLEQLQKEDLDVDEK